MNLARWVDTVPRQCRAQLDPGIRQDDFMSSRRSRHQPSRPHRLALAAVAAVAALAAVACGPRGTLPGASGIGGAAGGSTGGASAGGSPLSWRSCPVSGVSMQCARLTVPLDYSHPGGRKITLALSRVPATAPPGQRLGVLLVNPGGPGGSGLTLAADVAAGLAPAVAARYEIVGFDPRGLGQSTPALSCEPGFFTGVRPDYIPATAAAERALEDRAKTYAADCEKKFGWMLPYLTTRDSARDMDSIRAALGQRQISYFAYSYGTYLGQVYATMFPSHVRRMALDSVVGPDGVWYTDNVDQDYAFQGRMNAFFAWVARYDATYHLGSAAAQVDRAWYRVRRQLAAHPVNGPSGQPAVGADEFDDTFTEGGYSDTLWPGLASALSAYYHSGTASQLISEYQEYGTQSENEFAVYNAVQCSDAAWPRSWTVWDAQARRVYRTAPFEAWDNTWFNAACAFWPVQGPATPMRIGAHGLPGILMLQGTLDPATPYAGAMQAHRLLTTSRIVVVTGGGNHGQSLANPANTCVNGYLDRYLATGALPAAGGAGAVNATCPAMPAPAPGS